MKKELEVYELCKQLEYFYGFVLNIKGNLENISPEQTASIRRFATLKEQVDQHIADIIDELQQAKNGALS